MAGKYRCQSPVRVWYEAAQGYLDVRCRRCDRCRLMVQYSWLARSAHEQARAKGVWFVTLTFGPVRRREIFASASAMSENGASSTNRLVRSSGRHVAKFFKLLRKAGFKFRYIFVAELHRDGFPHWHGVLFDQVGNLHWESIDKAWSSGFLVAKVVRDANAIRYVTKYIAKAPVGRVRASLNFGLPQDAFLELSVRSARPRSVAEEPQTTVQGPLTKEMEHHELPDLISKSL